MSWQAGQRIVAEATGGTVQGRRVAGGVQLYIVVAFRVNEWSWEKTGRDTEESSS